MLLYMVHVVYTLHLDLLSASRKCVVDRAQPKLLGNQWRIAPGPPLWCEKIFFRRFITNKLKIYEFMLC